ncbi:MAG TPA: YlxR family protein [Coriobacteriia bacterium]|nr:YlxR family protein [Coriobacteriia bacterium]
MIKQRKVPTRTCTGCATSSDKRQFVRFVRTPEGHVEVDPTGKANGRGAYLCADADCFEMARKRRRLDSALRVALKEDDYTRLKRDFDEVLIKQGLQQGE